MTQGFEEVGGCSLCVYCILMNKGQCLRSDDSEVRLVDAFVILIFLLEVVCCSNLCYRFNCRWNKWNHILKILPFHLRLEEQVAPKWMFRLFRFSVIKVPCGLSETQNKSQAIELSISGVSTLQGRTQTFFPWLNHFNAHARQKWCHVKQPQIVFAICRSIVGWLSVCACARQARPKSAFYFRGSVSF